jgi:hypothetical protein
LSAASVLCLAGAPAAQAATYVPAFTFKNTTLTYDDKLLLGYSFSSSSAKKIKAIGVYKTITSPPNNSLGIWDFSNPDTPDLLFQTVITTKGECESDFCWHPASAFPSPNNLPDIKADTLYVIATAWGSDPVPANIETSEITLISPGFNVGNNALLDYSLISLNENLALRAPNTSDPSVKKSYFTANLSFESDTVKTPSPLPLIGAAAAFGWSRKIRRRINPSS